MTAAIIVKTMESGNAPPANPAATASEVATAAPGAMNVTDWNSTPGRPTVCRARPLRPGGWASGRVGVGISGAAMRTYSPVRCRRRARQGETYWADTSMAAEGVGPLLASPVLHAAARSLFDGRMTATSFLYVDVTAPMPGTDAGHVDVPSFRGIDRRTVPGWFLLAMRRSGLFTGGRSARPPPWSGFTRGPGERSATGPRARRYPAQCPAGLQHGNSRGQRPHAAPGGSGRRPRPLARCAAGRPAAPRGGDRWEVRDNDAAIETYRPAELRISLPWKAEVYLDEADRERRVGHLDDLTAARAFSVLAAELSRRHRWPGGRPPTSTIPAGRRPSWPLTPGRLRSGSSAWSKAVAVSATEPAILLLTWQM